MKFEEKRTMTLDVDRRSTQSDIGDVFKSVLTTDSAKAGTIRRTNPMNMILEQCPAPLVGNRGNGRRPFWGPRAGHQTARVLELSGAHVHVLSRSQTMCEITGPGRRWDEVTLATPVRSAAEESARQSIGCGWKHYLDNIRKDVS